MPEADLILHGGSAVTVDRASTVAEAVAIRDGRILAVGPTAALEAHAGPKTRRIDLAAARLCRASSTPIPTSPGRG